MPIPIMIALRLFLLCMILAVTSLDVSAQETDSTKVPPAKTPADSLAIPLPDSTLIPTDSLPEPIVFKYPIPFLDEGPGLVVNDSLPTRHPALDPTGLLSDVAGSFLYDFGASGWPDGWSPSGVAPHDVALSFNDIPFDNSIVGTPDYELLPFALLQPFRLQNDRFGAPVTVNTRLRALDQNRPITEIRYRQSNIGLKSVLVFHSQQRRIPFKRQAGILGISLGYGGHGATGEYTGSALEGARQLFARLRYKHPWGSVELMNLTNRRRLGAHAGVDPGSGSYENIYNRLSATVEPFAQRQSLRNDLALTVRTQILADTTQPFTASSYWTASTFRYVLGDTLQARTSRLGYRLFQGMALGAGTLTIALEGWSEHLRNDSQALPDSLDISRSALHLSALARLPLGPLNLDLEPALHKTDKKSFLGGRARIDFSQKWLSLFGQASLSSQTSSWIQQYGWGDTIQPLSDWTDSQVANLQAGFRLKGGPFSLDVTGFINQSNEYADFFSSTSSDTIKVELFNSAVQWSGVTAELGIRKDASKGFYLTVTPTLYQFNDATASNNHATLSESLPELYVRGRFGMRYLIFKGDLDLDLYTRARLWSSFQSRTLHPETGLLVLRPAGSRPVDGSIAMDVVLEAGIRGAKLFLSFENVLSHPSIIVGNLLVPDYPLPAQRFRFGVHWPIQD